MVLEYNLGSTDTRLVVVGAADTALHYIGNWGEVWEDGVGDVLQKSTTPSDSVSLQFRGKPQHNHSSDRVSQFMPLL